MWQTASDENYAYNVHFIWDCFLGDFFLNFFYYYMFTVCNVYISCVALVHVCSTSQFLNSFPFSPLSFPSPHLLICLPFEKDPLPAACYLSFIFLCMLILGFLYKKNHSVSKVGVWLILLSIMVSRCISLFMRAILTVLLWTSFFVVSSISKQISLYYLSSKKFAGHSSITFFLREKQKHYHRGFMY